MGGGRNGTIDFLKFLFALMTVAYHGTIFYGDVTEKRFFLSGYIAVEFYFLVSGYTLAARAAKDQNPSIFNSNLEMIQSKILRIFPYIFASCLVANIFYLSDAVSLRALSNNLYFSVSDILGLQMLGFPTFPATGVAWYLSALFFVSFLIYPILRKNREMFTKYIAPVSALLLLGLIEKLAATGTDGAGLAGPGEWWAVAHKGLLRGYADISLGCVAYELKRYFDSLNKKSFMFAFFEIFGYALTIFYGVLQFSHDNRDFFIPLPLLLSVAVTFSNKSVLNRFFTHPIFNKLGVLSLSVYLSHFYLRKRITYFFPWLSPGVNTFQLYAAFFAVVTIFVLLNFLLGKWISDKIRTTSAMLCALFCMIALSEALLFVCNLLNL